jgi:hypothetical protein
MPSKAKPREQFDASEVEKTEKLALDTASKTISAIENAMAMWDATKNKPPDLKESMIRMKYFHGALSDWAKKMLKSRKADITSRVELLREFSDICYAYSRWYDGRSPKRT